MSLSLITTLLLLLSGSAQSDRTRMMVLDSGSGTAYRVELGADLSTPTVTSYNIPALAGFIDVDWDFEDDRLYILGRDYFTIQSIFVNGTGLRNVTTLETDSYVVAVEPFEKKVFTSVRKSRGQPAKIISMDTDGSNFEYIRQDPEGQQAPFIGIDYRNKYLYWTEYLCSCLYRYKYDQEGAQVERKYSHIYVKKNPRAMDFERKLLYGDTTYPVDGLYRIDFNNQSESRRMRSIYRYPSKRSDQTVYDPKTDRLFLYHNVESSEVSVLASNGTLLGTVQGITLTADKKKAVRINPQ